MASYNHDTSACIKRIEDTSQLTSKIQTETELIQEMLSCLKQKQKELQATFDKIDQLEVSISLTPLYTFFFETQPYFKGTCK